MPLLLVNEIYNGENSLSANAGDWVSAEANFSIRFAVGSGVSNKITYNHQGSNRWFTHQQGDFGDYGFVAGDTITCTYSFLALPPPWQIQTFVTTIDYISGNQMYINDPFILNPVFPPSPAFEHIDGRQFPTDNYVNGILIVADKEPDSINFLFNLATNGSTSLASVIDGELSTFQKQVVTGIPQGVPQLMTELINKSGSLIKDVDLTFVANAGSGWRDYRVRYKFFQWGVIKDGFSEPNYYDSADCLAPIVKIDCFAQYGNPNGVLTAKSENVEANTGGFDENYNGGVNAFTPVSIEWFDALGAPIDRLDYSGDSTFVALIDGPNQSNPNSTYRIGLLWRPVDGSVYQNIANTNIGENLLVVAPEIDFIGDGSVDPTIYQGFVDGSGAKWDLTDLSFTVLSPTQVQVSGKVLPNAQASALFSQYPDGERRSTLWVSISDFSTVGIYSNRVSLKIFDEDNYDAPTIGVQIPNVLTNIVLDHAQIDVTLPIPQTTTEDDVLYRSTLRLVEGVQYEGMRTRFWAFNPVTEEEFTLEDLFFSFLNVPFVNNKFEMNEVSPRGFNLPPTTDRNHISITRDSGLDIVGFYGVIVEYGWLSDWRYWLEQSNVDNFFFDPLESFNGKNKNWQRFFTGDWILRVSYYTRVDGIDDFNNQDIGIRPYEDEDAVTDWTFEVLSNGTFPSNLVADEVHKATAEITWNIGTYLNVWAEMTIEDFESGNRWVISSVLAQGGIVNNPLQPNGINSGLEVTFPAPNVARLVANVDTNVVSANQVCLSARIYSEEGPIFPFDYLLTAPKEATLAFSTKYKLSPISVYSGPIMKVRRGIDNATIDIPFNNVEMDETFLLNFVGTGIDDRAWIVKLYDQSGFNNHAIAPTFAEQPAIVEGGVVLTSVNGLASGFADGISNKFTLTTPVFQSAELTYYHVIDRDKTGINSLGLATSQTNPIPVAWTLANRTIDLVGAVANIFDANDLTTGNFLFTSNRVLPTFNVNVRKDGNFQPLSFIVPPIVGQFYDQLLERTIPQTNHEGGFQEFVLFTNDRGAQIPIDEANIKNRYNIP